MFALSDLQEYQRIGSWRILTQIASNLVGVSELEAESIVFTLESHFTTSEAHIIQGNFECSDSLG